MKFKIVAVLLIVILVSLFGRQPKQILDDIEMPAVIGYDYVKKDKFKTTVVIPLYLPDKSVETRTVSAEDELSKMTATKINEKTSRPSVNGKVEVTIYGERLAKHGIGGLIDTLQRDPAVSEKLYLTVVDGKAKSLLEQQYGPDDTGVYLSRLVEQNIKSGIMPTTNLHYFLSAYYSKVRDPYLPLLEKKGDQVVLKGIALFKDDRYMKNIHLDHLFVFKLLIEDAKQGAYKLKLNNDNKYVFLQAIRTKNKYTVRTNKGVPEIDITLNVSGNIREYRSGKLNDKKILEIEKQMEELMEKQAKKMIRSFQKAKIDPLGLGDKVRSNSRKFNYAKWTDQYPNVKVNVKAKVKILEKGVTNGD